MEKTIWSNDATAYDFEWSRQMVADDSDVDVSDVADDAVYRYIDNDICLTLDAEEENLDVPTRRIVAFGVLGLWCGKAHQSRILPTPNLSEILHGACRDSEEYTVYYDSSDGEVKAKDVHHDGTNHYLFRELVSGISPDDEEAFLELVKSGAAKLEDINKFTASLGPRVEPIYGWRREAK